MSDQPIRLSFSQIDSAIGGSFWPKDSLISHILFELHMPIQIFSPVYLFLGHPLLPLKESLILICVPPEIPNYCYIHLWITLQTNNGLKLSQNTSRETNKPSHDLNNLQFRFLWGRIHLQPINCYIIRPVGTISQSGGVLSYVNYTHHPTVFWMGFYAGISWESRCSSEIKVWGHLCQILVVFEVPDRPRVKGMSGNS